MMIYCELILEVQAFVLNFNGRVDKPSVKNFQLVDMSNGTFKYSF